MANSNGWGDGAANNSIGWGQGANNNIGWGDSHAKSWAGATDIVGITTDADAQAFITAAAITDPTQQTAINNLVVGMKADGIWTKMKAIYPFVGGTASTHKWNLKDPRDLDAAFRLVFNGGWTHSSNGATPNGTNGYADTKLVPSSVLSQNSTHLSFYSRSNILNTLQFEIGSFNVGTAGLGSSSLSTTSAHFTTYLRTNSTGATCDIGSYLSNARMILYSRYPSSETYATISNSGYPIGVPFSTTDSTGFWQTIRENNTNTKIFQNTIKKADGAVAFSTLPNVPFYIGAVNNTSVASLFSNRQTSFSTIGNGLTDTEAANLYTRVQAFQTSLSRQV